MSEHVSYSELFSQFSEKHVISLKSRPDRRKRVIDNLNRLGIDFDASGIRWFDALQYESAEGFPGVGVRGCFNSHLALLKRCSSIREPMIIMEDDIEFIHCPTSRQIETMKGGDWDIIYFGYCEPDSLKCDHALELYLGPTIGGHFYAIKPDFASRMVEFMESCLTRPPGHPDGGPMYRDGAFNHYRKTNSDIRILLATPALALQFSSRSDLALRPSLIDRLTIMRPIVESARELKSTLSRLRRRT